MEVEVEEVPEGGRCQACPGRCPSCMATRGLRGRRRVYQEELCGVRDESVAGWCALAALGVGRLANGLTLWQAGLQGWLVDRHVLGLVVQRLGAVHCW
jgi:hypothetical protein